MEVRLSAEHTVILDGGTGLRDLGRFLLAESRPVRADLFLTHYHLDHIQGLPFFTPLYEESTSLRIHGPSRAGRSPRFVLGRCLTPLFFPVEIRMLGGRVEFETVSAEGCTLDGVHVTAARADHPGTTVGYRIEAAGRVIVYVPDNELGGNFGAARRGALRRLAEGADLLIHDAMYTEAEYQRRRGWGHSTHEQAIAFAEELGAAELVLFHHSPDRTDAELSRLVESHRARLRQRGVPLTVIAAREGDELVLDAATVAVARSGVRAITGERRLGEG